LVRAVNQPRLVVLAAIYLTGIIKWAYGVLGYMTYGIFVFVAAVGYPANRSPIFTRDFSFWPPNFGRMLHPDLALEMKFLSRRELTASSERANAIAHRRRHLASAAFRAISRRRCGLSRSARLGPPFIPPSRPKAAACARRSEESNSHSSRTLRVGA
jgi:hypothetical protein